MPLRRSRWQAAPALAAIDGTSAAVFDASNQRLSKVSGGTVAPATGALISDVTFLGFTTPAVGFAITVGEDGTTTQLLRTEDGGTSWSVVRSEPMSNNGDDELERRLRDVLLRVVSVSPCRRTPSIAFTPVRVDVSNGAPLQARSAQLQSSRSRPPLSE